jgi:signal transduction histidine kinase
MTEADPSAREGRSAARERQSHVRHDLRSPLAVMYPLLSLLLGETAGGLTPKQREYLETMERNVERLERLLVSATESGWMDCSTAPAEPGVIPLHQVAEEAIALAQRDEHGDLQIKVTGADRAAIADWEDVRLIVGALVRNAATHGRAGGAVEIRLGDDSGAESGGMSTAVTVSDDGPGMPDAELARAGEFGFRGAEALAARTPGLGIGLWVCRRLAERNGGGLDIALAAAGGLAVTVALPAAEGSPA